MRKGDERGMLQLTGENEEKANFSGPFCGTRLVKMLTKIIFLELIALIGSAAIAIIFGFSAVIISDYLYNANHMIPNQAERGYDLGNGFVVVFSVIGSTLFCVPFAIWFHFYIFRNYFK